MCWDEKFDSFLVWIILSIVLSQTRTIGKAKITSETNAFEEVSMINGTSENKEIRGHDNNAMDKNPPETVNSKSEAQQRTTRECN